MHKASEVPFKPITFLSIPDLLTSFPISVTGFTLFESGSITTIFAYLAFSESQSLPLLSNQMPSSLGSFPEILYLFTAITSACVLCISQLSCCNSLPIVHTVFCHMPYRELSTSFASCLSLIMPFSCSETCNDLSLSTSSLLKSSTWISKPSQYIFTLLFYPPRSPLLKEQFLKQTGFSLFPKHVLDFIISKSLYETIHLPGVPSSFLLPVNMLPIFLSRLYPNSTSLWYSLYSSLLPYWIRPSSL